MSDRHEIEQLVRGKEQSTVAVSGKAAESIYARACRFRSLSSYTIWNDTLRGGQELRTWPDV